MGHGLRPPALPAENDDPGVNPVYPTIADAAPAVAVPFTGEVNIDAVFTEVVITLRHEGAHVGGLLQRFGERLSNGKRSMWLQDIASGALRRIDQPRGPGATSCVLDADALAQAACDLRRVAESGADLAVVNRFGKSEAEGRGMRAEIAEVMAAGIPLLIGVRADQLDAWTTFLGAPAMLLRPDPYAILSWVRPLVRTCVQAKVTAWPD